MYLYAKKQIITPMVFEILKLDPSQTHNMGHIRAVVKGAL